MVGGTPKPFACTHEGCNMTFTNEDHLNVHQKKHEMDLNLTLGTKPNTYVDQTPTPTSFLRNCEEVGLFQDLQNVNPFEETFRKAVELGKTGSLPEPDLPTDDTLHTPHVFPLLTQENRIYTSQICSGLSSKPDNDITRDLDLSKNIFDNENLKETLQKKDILIDSIDHDYALEINKDLTENKVEKNTTKSKLKQALTRKKTLSFNVTKNVSQTVYVTPINIQKIDNTPTNDNLISFITPTIVKLPILNTNTVINNVKPKETSKTSKKNESELNNTIREQMLERNRAAAMRCREKRKRWITDLESNYERVCKHNHELMKDVCLLKNEVLQLKTLLLAHKDCPVTKSLVSTGDKLIPNPAQLFTLQITDYKMDSKNRLVLPKEDIRDENMLKTKKIRKVEPKVLNINNLSILPAPTQKSVIVLNTTYNDIPSS